MSLLLPQLNLTNNELCGLNWRGEGTYTSEGIKAVAGALKVNASLTKLDIQMNEIGSDGALAIAQAITEAPSLALMELVVPQGIERDEHLKAACQTKGVKLV